MTTVIRSAESTAPGEPLRLVDRKIADPGPGEVRLRIEASGVCHTDAKILQGAFGTEVFPVVPGHEIAGRIESVGEGVRPWRVGDRVTVGWYGGHCGWCDPCRRGDFLHCENTQIPGVAYPGGYAEMIVVPANALARIPDTLTAVQAAPLACAGVTVFNALRRSAARAGDTVAVVGLGGLGHLGVQFAAAMGMRVVVVARGEGKRDLATALGAHHYIDSTAQDVPAALRRLGPPRVALATAANSEAMVAALDGLGDEGELLVIGVEPEPMPVSPLQLITPSKRISGHPSGTATDVEDALTFAALTGVRAVVEEFTLEDAPAAYAHMMSGRARFRAVLVPALTN
ncbi:alcohol dehydrogenase catalytic domain-containing protein [Kineococcus sp. SYSU DK003]|uniref:alcohol dehydrogenase catalytic domain-containing protein n=1 Tax=Kineococcus sp. SYSU DK003 TaxID=3383124 RepID=UPI003D7E43A6